MFENFEYSTIDEFIQDWDESVGEVSEQLTERSNSAYQKYFGFSSLIPLKVRGMGVTPIYVVSPEVEQMPPRLASKIRSVGTSGTIQIVVCLSDKMLSRQRWGTLIKNNNCLLLSKCDLESVMLHAKPLKRLQQFVVKTFKRKKLVPFSTSLPACGNVFVGRKSEVKMLTSSDQDFTICGPGGIGKTSLVRQSIWTLEVERDPRRHRIVEVDLIGCEGNANAAAKEIAQRIHATKFSQDLGYKNLVRFFRHERNINPAFKDGPIELFIDEVDALLAVDRRAIASKPDDGPTTYYPFLRTLLHARHHGLIRMTLIGRTETSRFLNDPENPFVVKSARGDYSPSRLKLISLEPLPTKDATELLLGTLDDLDYPVEEKKPELLKKLAQCSGVPFDIQDLGLSIISGFEE